MGCVVGSPLSLVSVKGLRSILLHLVAAYLSPGKPSSPYSLPFHNVFPCTADVGSALFFERVVREWRVGRECPRQHTEHVIMMEMKILTFDKHVVVKRRGNSQPVNPTPGEIANTKRMDAIGIKSTH